MYDSNNCDKNDFKIMLEQSTDYIFLDKLY